MSERSVQPGPNGGPPRNGHPAPAPAPTGDGFDELRAILVGPEQKELAQLRDPEARLEEISDAIPEAIARRGPNDKLLIASLRPVAQETVAQLVKFKPQFFADLLTPVIAPTIRRAIAQAFESTLEALRQMTERTFSLQGLKWRLEAMRSGVSVAEIALRHTVLYRVEQVFLIHKETGVLLEFAAAEGAPGADSDMVSGMLTAVRQFMSDSFHTPEAQNVDAVKIGEFLLWVEPGPHAILAATIRGTPPADLHGLLQDTLDGIHVLLGETLEKFAGDTKPFEACRPELAACLRSESSVPVRSRKSGTSGLKVVLGLLVVALAGWLIARGLAARTERLVRQSYVDALATQRGLVTTFIDAASQPMRVRGLRDPLAVDPAQLARDAGLDPHSLDERWETFFCLEPDFVLRRARGELMPPTGVTLDLDRANRALQVSGRAPNAWIVQMRRNARAVPGVARVDETRLVDADLSAWRELAARAESVTVRFTSSDDALAPAQREEIVRVAVIAREAAEAAQLLGRGTQVEVSGELFRASAVASALSSTAGVPPTVVRAAPPATGSTDAVSFRLLLTDSAPPPR